MKLFLHTLNSWGLSIFSLVTVLLVISLFHGAGDDFYYVRFGEYIALLFFSIVAGSPSLFIAWFLLPVIIELSFSEFEKLIVWYMTVIGSIVANVVLALIVFPFEAISPDVLLNFWPAYLAAFIILTLRCKQFFNLIYKKTDDGNF